MVENLDQIMTKINKYIELLNQANITVEKAYLFGSFARGNADEYSDINVAIISDRFSGVRFDDRRMIVPLRRSIDNRIEAIPFRKEAFNTADPLAAEILTNGVEIK